MGFHVHKAAWTPSNGKLLSCVIELSNMMDKYADAVQDKDQKVVGHLPRKNQENFLLMKKIFYFLIVDKNHSCRLSVTGKADVGDGLGYDLAMTWR